MSDIDTAMVVDSLKVLDPKPPIREADIMKSLKLDLAGIRLRQHIARRDRSASGSQED